MSTVLDQATYDRCQVETKEGKAFLRKVARESLNLNWSDNWHAMAGASTEWRLQFRRTIKGELGEPSATVKVTTDVVIRRSGKTGLVKSFHDSKEVMVLTPRVVYLDGQTAGMVAKMILEGYSFCIETSAGSTTSSFEGLAFYSIAATRPDFSCGSLYVGGETVTKDGRCIIRSAVTVD